MIDVALLVYEECRDTRLSVFGRPGDHREAANEAIVDDVAVFACWSCGTLGGEDLEIVAGIRSFRVLDFGGGRATYFTLGCIGRPVETGDTSTRMTTARSRSSSATKRGLFPFPLVKAIATPIQVMRYICGIFAPL